jgi:hypothetical protein
MSRLFKDGKQYTPKTKIPKPKRVEESFAEHNIALFLQKRNLIERNIADDFLDAEIREKIVSERVEKLKNLSPHELLIRLAKAELKLEVTEFLYGEAYKQKQFLEDAYLKSGEKRLIHAANKVAGKAKLLSKYTPIKETARQILGDMKEPDFKILRRKLRAKFSTDAVSDGTIRNYFQEITGLKSTK